MAAAMTDTINNNNQCIPSIESLSIASPSPSLSSPLIPRTIDTIVTARETAEGLGARVRRVIGGGQIDSLDPFLLFDHAIINANAGFPDHPHRGFETVSYALPWSKGTMIHEDFTGKKGEEKAGDVQWMTAGRGIVHSEIPLGDGVCEGIQIWVNLRAKDKMIKPYYQDFKANQIPTIKQNGIEVRVISGESMGTKASTRTLTPVYYLHITMESNKRMEQSIPTDYNCIIYVLKGSIFIGRDANDGKENPEEKISQYQAVTMVHKKSSIIDNGKQGGVIIRSFGGGEASFLLLAGQPLNEPIARYGPFVMNSQQQIMEAFRDYQNGKGGFEKAKGWKSTIGTKFQQRYYEKKNKKGKKKGKTRGDSDSDDNDDY